MSRTQDKRTQYRRGAFLAWLFTALQAAAALTLLFAVLMFPERMNGTSMAPTLQPGEILLVDRVTLFLRAPRRGDIVIFKNPRTGEELIKRVVALPHETVQIAGGSVYIDGRLLFEGAYSPDAAKDYGPAVVPEGRVFALGDERNDSLDSRDPSIGCIPFASLDGRVRFRLFPVERLAVFL